MAAGWSDSAMASSLIQQQQRYAGPLRQWRSWGAEENDRTKKTRAGRTLRNKKYRRAVEDTCKTKRLFTPEIKKFLKDWLIRRRKNPYPNRSEKKDLALKTGLTYMQICNWFANWRRKLKKSSQEAEGGGGAWGRLIAGYNQQARGNVEHISVSSEDSLWDETNCNQQGLQPHNPDLTKAPCYWTSQASRLPQGPPLQAADPGQSLLLKWLESAARYRPRERRALPPPAPPSPPPGLRHREELDAAEALTFLSRARLGQCV